MKWEVKQGDCREILAAMPAESVHCCVTSPPYFGLRDYGCDGQIGLEATPAAYVDQMVAVFREVRRVLRNDGTLWLNLGDSYAAQRGGTAMPAETLAGGVGGQGDDDAHRGHGATHAHRNARALGLKHKDLIGIPWRVAFALQADGWYLRQDIIWHKPNPMPESVRDRCTKAHEYLFLLSKSERYYFDSKAIAEPAQSWTGRAATFDRSGNKVAEHVLPGQSAAQHRPRVNEADRKELRTDTESRHRASIPGGQSMQAEPNGTRNRRSVWTVATQPFAGAHFATFPPRLIEPCILAGCPPTGVVLDPFTGSGTTGAVAIKHARQFVGCELNAKYIKLAEARIQKAYDEALW